MRRALLITMILAMPLAAPAIQFADSFWSTSFICPAGEARYGYCFDGLGIDDSGYPDDDCNGLYSRLWVS